MNRVFPRQLWVKTVNAVSYTDSSLIGAAKKRISQDDIILDPLQVLRCDKRVFRCAPMLEILLYILKACLAASRTHLSQHILDNPIVDRAAPNAQVCHNFFNWT